MRKFVPSNAEDRASSGCAVVATGWLELMTTGGGKSARVTVNIATALLTLPEELATTTLYPPSSLFRTLFNVSVAVCAPETFPPSTKSTPSLRHW
jgi:hypothetical protein